jgi:hypothetical protein
VLSTKFVEQIIKVSAMRRSIAISIACISALTFSVVMGFTYVVFKSSCYPVINSNEEAIDSSKAFILGEGNQKLMKIGGDSSIFENSKNGVFGDCATYPPRSHYALKTFDNLNSIYWKAFIKGKCATCWEIIQINVGITSCGKVEHYFVSRHRVTQEQPTAPEELRHCLPSYWPPGSQ